MMILIRRQPDNSYSEEQFERTIGIRFAFVFNIYICIVKRQHSISDILPKHLAWDMDIESLDINRDRDIIIPRALLATTPATFLQDICNLERVYTKNQIVKELKSTKERISNKVCVLVSERYHVPIFARFK